MLGCICITLNITTIIRKKDKFMLKISKKIKKKKKNRNIVIITITKIRNSYFLVVVIEC